MTSVWREIWAECCEGGAYRDGVVIHISWREGKVCLLEAQRILTCSGAGQGKAGAGAEKLGSWLLFHLGGEAIGSVDLSWDVHTSWVQRLLAPRLGHDGTGLPNSEPAPKLYILTHLTYTCWARVLPLWLVVGVLGSL